ncbi:MAG: CotH kinase family protein [Woeseiaceae bacterium]
MNRKTVSKFLATTTIFALFTGCGTSHSDSDETTLATTPDAPTIESVTAGDASATIVFTAPANDGGATIERYDVTCVGDASSTTTGTSSPISVAGLTNGITYDCSVTATNSVGTSSASSSLSTTPETMAITDADFEAADWTEETHSNDVDPNHDEVFDDTLVKRFDFVITEERWQSMLDDMTATYGELGQSAGAGLIDTDEDPIFVPADVFYNGTQWYRVGVRFKGNSSLQSSWQQGILKLSFKMDFDEFEDDYPQIDNQRFFGFKKFSLKNNFDDRSQVREKVASDVFAKAGVPVSHTGFYTLYVDHGNGPEYFGLYTLVEEVDGEVLDTQFTSDDGNLYKPEDAGATFVNGSFSEEDFEKKTNEDDEDWTDVLTLFAALHDDTASTDPVAWRTNLEAIFNVDGFLKYLAVNQVIQNWDSYGKMTQNYYLYNDPETSKLTWIPWDHNEALQVGKRGGALALDFSNLESNNWPLIEFLYADPIYKAQYDSYLLDVIGTAFDTTATQMLYDTYSALIEPWATTERNGYSFLNGANDFYNAIDDLKSHASSRATAVDNYWAEK